MISASSIDLSAAAVCACAVDTHPVPEISATSAHPARRFNRAMNCLPKVNVWPVSKIGRAQIVTEAKSQSNAFDNQAEK
jgi:hypothetical protein